MPTDSASTVRGKSPEHVLFRSFPHAEFAFQCARETPFRRAASVPRVGVPGNRAKKKHQDPTGIAHLNQQIAHIDWLPESNAQFELALGEGKEMGALARARPSAPGSLGFA